MGWKVWGFDPAEAGIAIAQKQAKDLGLTLHTSTFAEMQGVAQSMATKYYPAWKMLEESELASEMRCLLRVND